MNYSKLLTACILSSTILWMPLPITLAHASDDEPTNTEKANALREAASHRAKAYHHFSNPHGTHNFSGFFGGYGNLSREELERLNYQVLSEQIARLAAAVKALDPKVGMSSPMPGMSITPPKPSNFNSVYGPKGPTVESVRLILEHRMRLNDNPRLKIGKITENADHLVAPIVTIDGSLVEKFTIDKKTGVWSTVR